MGASYEGNEHSYSDLAMYDPREAAERRGRLLEEELRRSDPQACVCHESTAEAFYNYRVVAWGHGFIVGIPWSQVAEIGQSDEKAVASLIRKLSRLARGVQQAVARIAPEGHISR